MPNPINHRSLILASGSPRRRELLGLTELDFEVRPAAADETLQPAEVPETYAQRMSRTKAALIADSATRAVVIGADTMVVLDDETRVDGQHGAPSILGKPRDAAEAASILRRLRGRRHRVITSVSVMDSLGGAAQHDWVTASVPMRAYRDDEIATYVATGNPL